MMCPKQHFAVGMNFLDMRECLEKIFIKFFISKCAYLEMINNLFKHEGGISISYLYHKATVQYLVRHEKNNFNLFRGELIVT